MCTVDMWQRESNSIGTMGAIVCTCWGDTKRVILRKENGAEFVFSEDEWAALVACARSGGPVRTAADR
jgi:hypothetical protein